MFRGLEHEKYKCLNEMKRYYLYCTTGFISKNENHPKENIPTARYLKNLILQKVGTQRYTKLA